jgi:hypothetical protein
MRLPLPVPRPAPAAPWCWPWGFDVPAHGGGVPLDGGVAASGGATAGAGGVAPLGAVDDVGGAALRLEGLGAGVWGKAGPMRTAGPELRSENGFSRLASRLQCGPD